MANVAFSFCELQYKVLGHTSFQLTRLFICLSACYIPTLVYELIIYVPCGDDVFGEADALNRKQPALFQAYTSV